MSAIPADENLSIHIAESLTPRPPRSMSPQQQLESLRKAQRQAEQRVQLGMQLFKAAEARLSAGQDVVGQVRREQDALRDEMRREREEDASRYNKQLADVEQTTDARMAAVERQIARLQLDWQSTQDRLGEMMARCQAMLDQTRHLLSRAAQPPAAAPQVEEAVDDAIEEDDEDIPAPLQMPAPGSAPGIKNLQGATVPAAQIMGPFPRSAASGEVKPQQPERPVFSRVIDQLRASA